jgi:hypothetical protein
MVFVVAAPPAYVYNVPATHSCTLVPCGVPHHDESPAEPDHDYLEGSLWVQTVTGGPNELSPMPEVTLTTARFPPSQKSEVPRDFTPKIKIQPHALGQPQRNPWKIQER